MTWAKKKEKKEFIGLFHFNVARQSLKTNMKYIVVTLLTAKKKNLLILN